MGLKSYSRLDMFILGPERIRTDGGNPSRNCLFGGGVGGGGHGDLDREIKGGGDGEHLLSLDFSPSV